MHRLFALILVLALFAAWPCLAAEEKPTLKQVIEKRSSSEEAEPKKKDKASAKAPARPAATAAAPDSPQTTVRNFVRAVREGNYEAAAEFLDLGGMPQWDRAKQGPRLAFELGVVFERALLIDYDLLSANPRGDPKDGLHPSRDRVDYIKLPDQTVEVTLKRIRGSDGRYQWKFSRHTVAAIPLLYAHFGYSKVAELITSWLPAGRFLGLHLWQWTALAMILTFSVAMAFIITALLRKLLLRRKSELSQRMAQTLNWPLRILLWVVIGRLCIDIMSPSVVLQAVLRSQTVLLFALVWTVIRLLDIVADRLALRMAQKGQDQSLVLLKPAVTITKVLLLLTAGVIWLDNLGFKVTTIIASLGVGGIAVALAAQDTLKNFIGSIAVLLDKPFKVGERVVVQGHDGVVEEIGLRSTKMRLLTGNQAVIPNETMARLDIENIGRRPHIRRRTNIGIAYDTPREKVVKAVEIIKEVLENHEGMHPDFPPRVSFNEFNPYSLNILVFYWYHPPDYWASNDFAQEVNLEIMRLFEEEGIHFAYPTSTTFLASDPDRPLEFKVKPPPG